MPNHETKRPQYYDGSMNVQFSKEISAAMKSNQEKKTEPVDIDKCRHLLGANPFHFNDNPNK
jgi:hypothetical protein